MAVSACSSSTHNPPLLAASPQTSRHSLLVSLHLPGISSCLPSRLTTFRKSARLYSLGTHFPDSPFSTPEDGLSIELQPILDEGQFDSALSEAQQRSQPIIVDWMAAWCRKCIYLKPKLEKLAAEFHPDVKFYCLDVNAVPQALVKRADVTSMPTIQLWKDGKKCDEVIGGHKAWLVMDEVREMLQKHVR